MNSKILFTGGHFNSSVAVIDWLSEKGSIKTDFVWVGKKYTKGSCGSTTPEYIEVSRREIPFYHLNAGKLFRTTSIRFFPSVILGILLIPAGFVQSLYILLKERPSLVVSFGGFLALPVVVCSKLLGIKTVTHEQTVVLGLANQIISKFAENIYTSWPVRYYKVSPKIRQKMVYTGLPLSSGIFKEDKKINFNNNLPVIYATGGKAGAKFINSLILNSLPDLLPKANLVWSFGGSFGEKTFAEAKDSISKLKKEAKGKVILRKYIFEDEIGAVYSISDLVVCRGGAHTIYEIALLKKKALVIPIPWSSNNEQYLNACIIEKLGLGKILEQELLTSQEFVELIVSMIFGDVGRKTSEAMYIERNGQEKLGNEIIKHLKA